MVFTLTLPAQEPTVSASRPPTTTGVTETLPDDNYYVVQPGDTLFVIAQDFGVDMTVLANVNSIPDVDRLEVGQVLLIPQGTAGARPEPPPAVAPGIQNPAVPRASITERLTVAAREAAEDSPYYRQTWLTYYGRPGIALMGILGEHDVITLTNLLREHAALYDAANGPDLAIRPAFHLVYGMATKAGGDDGMHLDYLPDEVVMQYIEAGQRAGIDVLLDIQIGAYTPVDSVRRALPFLKHPNVHLALDPEFAMVFPGQAWPGDPIGYVTAAQVNEVQTLVDDYMEENRFAGKRVLLVHQFLGTMLDDKDELDWNGKNVQLTLSVDGWGSPWAKITKYNEFVDSTTKFSAFKLFFGWDEPLLSERQALGEDAYLPDLAIDVTPNMIIYQ